MLKGAIWAASTFTGKELLKLVMTARRMGTKNKGGVIPDCTSSLWARKSTHIKRSGSHMFSSDIQGVKNNGLLPKLVQVMSFNLETMCH